MYQRFLKQDYTEKTGRAFEAFGYAVLEQKQDLKRVIQSQKSSSPNLAHVINIYFNMKAKPTLTCFIKAKACLPIDASQAI